MSAEDVACWDEEKEKDLVSDPRFEAAVELRRKGQYDDSIEFFTEMLKTFDGEEPPLFTAPLYFQYGSTLVCCVEAGEGKGEDDEGGVDQTGEKEETEADEAIEIMGGEVPSGEGGELSSKRPKIDVDSSGVSHVRVAGEDGNASGKSVCDGGSGGGGKGGVSNDDEEEEAEEEEEEGEPEGDDDEDSAEGSSEAVAWQCLDTARDLYQQALTRHSGDSSLGSRLRNDLSRTVSRLGDLNMATGCFADALVEYEQVLKLREQEQDTSVAGVCRVVDTNVQIAFAYLEHLNASGEVDVVVTSTDGERVTVTAGEDCKTQMLAYREQAKKAMETLLTRLSDGRVSCTPEDKELICVQVQLLEEFNNRVGPGA